MKNANTDLFRNSFRSAAILAWEQILNRETILYIAFREWVQVMPWKVGLTFMVPFIDSIVVTIP